ncbi:hypothetical protein DERP_004512 [Dermatophagoides pteronyssinus]|uniref:Uncharacterized protein n=1 Tax=Dermatophagoides pteronyssinus TaxID=6956 RepID=A0ABQ8JPQ6_DERPT|nr:hypothetical protein DERP_004512 [Dermatophagoides pteronyssinus]
MFTSSSSTTTLKSLFIENNSHHPERQCKIQIIYSYCQSFSFHISALRVYDGGGGEKITFSNQQL